MEKNLENLLGKSPGHQYSFLDKLFQAIRFTKESIASVFSVGISVAKEIRYQGEGLAFFAGMLRRSPEYKKEKADRQIAAAKRQRDEAIHEMIGRDGDPLKAGPIEEQPKARKKKGIFKK